MIPNNKNTVCLWYDHEAEAAARFYANTFPDSQVLGVHYAPADYPAGRAGDVITVSFDPKETPVLALGKKKAELSRADIVKATVEVYREKTPEELAAPDGPTVQARESDHYFAASDLYRELARVAGSVALSEQIDAEIRGLDAERTELQLDLPLYLDHPAPSDARLKLRAVLMLRQNF